MENAELRSGAAEPSRRREEVTREVSLHLHKVRYLVNVLSDSVVVLWAIAVISEKGRLSMERVAKPAYSRRQCFPSMWPDKSFIHSTTPRLTYTNPFRLYLSWKPHFLHSQSSPPSKIIRFGQGYDHHE